jgi:DNA primase catalytic core
MLDKIVESCRYLIDNFPEAQNTKSYLDSRLSLESQELFQFGYFPGIKELNSLTDMIGEEILYKEGLLFSKEIEDSLYPRTINFCYFEDYPLIMPFKDAYGKIVALVGRSLLSDEERKYKKISKYKNTKFLKGNFVFGLYENKKDILDQNCVYIVEGQFDVIKASEKGFKNIVALGSSSMTIYQFSVISRYTNNIFLLLDNDEAGEKGRKRIVDKFGKFSNIQNFYIPENYKDIDEYLTKSNDTSISFFIKD